MPDDRCRVSDDGVTCAPACHETSIFSWTRNRTRLTSVIRLPSSDPATPSSLVKEPGARISPTRKPCFSRSFIHGPRPSPGWRPQSDWTDTAQSTSVRRPIGFVLASFFGAAPLIFLKKLASFRQNRHSAPKSLPSSVLCHPSSGWWR
jgi:hypothetical protein